MSCRGYHCARARRSARRQHLQAEYRLNAELKAAINGEYDEEKPALPLNKRSTDRVTKALSVCCPHGVTSAGSRCLPGTSLYFAGGRKSKPASGYGVTAKV